MPEIGVTRVSRWLFNCYVIGGSVVVDPGLPSAANDLAPILGDGVAAVVGTHGHSDHLGGAAGVARRYDAPIHLPATTLSYLDGARPRTPNIVGMARIWPTTIGYLPELDVVPGLIRGVLTSGYASPLMRWTGPAPTGGLVDGQPLPGAPEWTVLDAPGHTDDSVAFWNETTRTLISGDAVLTARGRAYHTPEVVDRTLAHATRVRLSALPVEHLLPGHGLPVHDARTVWRR